MARLHREKRARRTYWRLKVQVDGETHRLGLGYDLDENALKKLEVVASKLESLQAVGERPDSKLVTQLNRELSNELLSKFAEVGLISRATAKARGVSSCPHREQEGSGW